MINIARLFGLLFVISLTVGCTQRIQDFGESFKFAYHGYPDITKSWEEIQRLPYASMYAQLDGGPRGFLVLGFVEPSQHPAPNLKWLSAENEMLVTRDGRLVKTVNLTQGNLIKTIYDSPDPLSYGLLDLPMPQSWSYHIDWQPNNHSGYQVRATFERGETSTLDFNGTPIKTVSFYEKISIPELNKQYTNRYWVNAQTGRLIQSYQYLAPGLPAVTLTYLKDYQSED